MRTLPWIAVIAGASLLVACGQKEEAAVPAAENATGVAGDAATAPADPIKAREANFKELGKNLKAVSDELKRDKPDMAVIQAGTARLNELAPQVKDWFPEGSGPAPGVETEAKANIWTDRAGFETKHAALVDNIAKLNATALTGDIATIKAALPAAGGACKGCHDVYRQEKEKK